MKCFFCWLNFKFRWLPISKVHKRRAWKRRQDGRRSNQKHQPTVSIIFRVPQLNLRTNHKRSKTKFQVLLWTATQDHNLRRWDDDWMDRTQHKSHQTLATDNHMIVLKPAWPLFRARTNEMWGKGCGQVIILRKMAVP